ncbi:hypothetical protein CHLNCDRAFT_142222 [Chlorella variabilis]|uniref:Alpha 1,4-glycosyltransferase domain-containing protein n=1 Tax=Chlorella variabilis TaxID=554065 RepID=E1Z821_CHLVA|nr:hypothetical protein CHLNCDRAFT_142222 [Chlorella variabilis]EFN58265.1 hypothetical protein CHLNCDRAFT_142222 [Chlorella variabilis]|eukprot:XP_005850367.1 hypothetical protein CHLNCDRAFT_142222 [Chlorella variabilis]
MAMAAAAADALAPVHEPGRIPRILHRIYIADPRDKKRANFSMPIAHERYVESCQLHYSADAGWQHMFWDGAAAEALIANHYPSFLPFFQQAKAIERSDVARYAILHRLGGMYLDSDIECWREGSDMLRGFDLVAQRTHGGEGATNAAIAARPGLPVFTKALDLVQERDIDTDADVMKVIARTGPDLFTAALEAVGLQRTDGMFGAAYTLDGVAYRLWRVGTWFHPCQWWEQKCRRRVYVERASGQGDMRHLVGMHRMVGSWIPGKEDGIGILNVTAELCGGATHEGSNGQPGGWVAPKVDADLEEQRRRR